LSSRARSTTRAARRREQQCHPPPRQDRKARSARAEIQAAYRWRAANCLGLYRVAISGRVLNFLVKTGWLREDEVEDRREVENAIAAMLDDAAEKEGL
jgi:hypothetical protein